MRVDVLAKHWQHSTSEGLESMGMKLWEYDVLAALRRQRVPYSIPAYAFARAAMLTSGAMTTRIDQFEEKNWGLRHTDPDDRRGVLAELTARGLDLIDQAIESRVRSADEAVAALTASQQRTLASLLRKLVIAA